MATIPERLPSRQVVTLEAQHDYAFRTGHAPSMSLHHWRLPLSVWSDGIEGIGPSACYSHGCLAWIDPGGCRIHLMNIQSGVIIQYSTMNRLTAFWSLAMSESIIVSVMKARGFDDECLLWKYRAKYTRTFAVRPWIRSVTVSGNTFALFHTERLLSGLWRLSVTTYRVGDHQEGYFHIMTAPFSVIREGRCKLFVGPGGETIVFCYICRANGGTGAPEQIVFASFDLMGHIQAQGDLNIRNTEFASHKKFIEDSSLEIDGNVVIMVNVCSMSRSEISYVAYNVALKKLEIHGHSHPGTSKCAMYRDIFLRRDVAYWCEGTHNTDLVTLDIQERAYRVQRIEDCQYMYSDYPSEIANCWLQGDEFFMVRKSLHCIMIWSFAKGAKMYSGDWAWAMDLESRFMSPGREREMAIRRHFLQARRERAQRG